MTQPRLARTPLSPDIRRWLPLIVGMAVGIRIALGWVHPLELPDSVDYEALARAVAAHQPYASVNAATGETMIASRMPGYPLLLAAIYWLGGGVKTVMVLQGLMGGMTVILAYLIARRVHPGAGLVAAGLIAVDPLTIGFSASVLSETPFTLCLMAGLWLGLRIADVPRFAWRSWVALGVLWAIAVYLRAEALWGIVPLAVVSAWPREELRPRVSVVAAAIPIALAFALLAPWLVRNYQHFHTGFFRMTTLEGISLYEAVYPDADGGPKQDKIALPADMRALDEAQRSDEWSRRGWGYVRQDPLRIARLALVKVGRTWSPWFNAAEFRAGPIQLAMTLWNVPLYLLALVGLARAPRRPVVLLLVPIGYFTAVHALFLGSVRYRVPLMPLVCILAACGIREILNWFHRSKPLPS